MNDEILLRQQLIELLEGGFAPNVTLLKEFDHKKAGVVLEGLHFSAWVLLGHIRARQRTLLNFIKNPHESGEVWPEAVWPDNYQPRSRKEWEQEIEEYQRELEEVIEIVKDPSILLFQEYYNGKSISWAVLAILHHTGYHIGQLKAIGRQLGVW